MKFRSNICVLLLVFVLVQSSFINGLAQNQSSTKATISSIFNNPPEDAKPWTFWYWMYGAISKEALTKDLEAMKQAGLGGTYLMPIQAPDRFPTYPNPAVQLTPEWWKMVDHSLKEADRLGLKLGMHICDGFALAGGPWIKAEESMQKVVFTDTIIDGGKIANLIVRQPETNANFYKDIRLLAYPIKESAKPNTPKITFSSEVNSDGSFFRANAVDINQKSDGAWIQYEYAQPFTLRSVEIVKVNNNYQAQRLKVMASDDGIHYRMVKQLVPARQGWQNYDFNATHSVPTTTARYFRFYWNPAGSEPGAEDMNDAKWKPNLKIKDILLSSEARVNHWEVKAGLVWRVGLPTSDKEIETADCVQLNSVIDLTASFQNGKLSANLPKGKWKIIRLGHTSTGHTNATGGGGKGLECDKFSRNAVQKQFDNWFGSVYKNTDEAVARRTLKYVHVDSWECGSQNWSENFADEFRNRRGYDLMPYLMLYAGIPLESVAKSEQVMRDIRTTIAELVVDVFYDVISKSAKAYDCQLTAECVAPTMVSDGLLHYQKVDLPMGEFWYNSPTHDKFNDMLDAVSGAHIYGKNIVQAEGMTQLRGVWNEHPGTMKTLLDRNYALGVNKLFFHVFVHNPFLDKKPGMTLDGIGFFFQRDQTWWKNGAKAIVDYASRSQALLQYGKPVTDIAVFTGEEIPRRSILPENLVSSIPGIIGAKKIEEEKVRMANTGQPLRTLDGVTFSANMTAPENWINPLRGYAYDSFNKDVLLKSKAVNGQMVLPSGASYKVVVFPLSTPMNPIASNVSAEVKHKIAELKRGGVVIPDLPYSKDDFSGNQIYKDVIVPENIAWTHRKGEEADVYFVSNQSDETKSFDVSLRENEGQAQLWNATNGNINVVQGAKIENGRLIVPVILDVHESVFIVLVKNQSHYLALAEKNEKKIETSLPIKKWNIHFPEIDKNIETATLFDWSTNQDNQIKHYSGTAVYSAEFNTKKSNKSRYLVTFENVENVANIKVNGIDCGTIWTKPYAVDISKALRKGKNTIQIEVSNTWANAINGADNNSAPFDGVWTNGKYRMKPNELLPAGIFGELKIIETKH